MENFNSILLVGQVVLSISLITLILLQHGKGADAGAAFGGGASGSVFGAKGSGNFLSRTTAVLATLFFVVSMSLAYISSHRVVQGSVTEMGIESSTTNTVPNMMEDTLIPMMESADLPPADVDSMMKLDDDVMINDLPPE